MHLAPHPSMRTLSLQLAHMAIALCLVASGGISAVFGQFSSNSGTHTIGGIQSLGAPSNLPPSPLTEGKRLEREQRWQEAIMFYEKSLKKEARLRDVGERLQICRVQLDFMIILSKKELLGI